MKDRSAVRPVMTNDDDSFEDFGVLPTSNRAAEDNEDEDDGDDDDTSTVVPTVSPAQQKKRLHDPKLRRRLRPSRRHTSKPQVVGRRSLLHPRVMYHLVVQIYRACLFRFTRTKKTTQHRRTSVTTWRWSRSLKNERQRMSLTTKSLL